MVTLFVLGGAVLAIVYGLILIEKVLKMPSGNEKMQEIAKAIQEGAKAYLNRQYKTVAMVAVVLYESFDGIGGGTVCRNTANFRGN